MTAAQELSWKEHESITGVFEQLRQLELDRQDPADLHVSKIMVRTDGEVIDILTFPLGRVIIGRSPDIEIYIKSKFVSRHHAQLVSDESGCVIEDLNSTNGVFVGEKQVKKYRLHDGDVISLGVHELIYHDLRKSAELDDDKDNNAHEQDAAVDQP